MIKKLIVESESHHDPDHILIEEAKAGDDVAFKELVRRHKDKVRNLVFYMMNNEDHVEDVSQEVFIKLYKKLDKFRYESKFTTWLYRITVNHCRDELRKKKFWGFFNVFEQSHENLTFDHDPDHFDTKEVVHQALRKLPEKLRVPLIMKEMEGFSYKEIASITNTEMGTVKSRIFRAREQLKEILNPLREDLNI